MSLRILLPPNLSSAAARDAIPVKIVATGRSELPEVLASACAAERGPWLLQLKRAELRFLLQILKGQPAFLWANNPVEPLKWDDDFLPGVSPLLAEPEEKKTSAAPASATQNVFSRRPADETPSLAAVAGVSRTASVSRGPQVDGSDHYLAIVLPPQSHFAYEPLREILKNEGFLLEPLNRRWWLRDRHKTLNFLSRYWRKLEHEWAAFFTENFSKNTAKLQRATIEADAKEISDSFEVSLAVRAGDAAPEKIREHLASGRNYVENSGTVFLVEAMTLAAAEQLQRALSGDPRRGLMHRSTQRVARHRVAEVEALLESMSPNFKPPAAWQAQSAGLRNLESLAPLALSSELNAQLRSYQKLGAAWLGHLSRNRLGGILADEMGLGKTAQALALLSENSERCSLVVCPASLVENWRREAARFAPKLRVFAHHGTRRIEVAAAFSEYDLVVSSYGTLVRDQSLFEQYEFAHVIADEAQHVKNRRTQAASALRALNARARFCLTGTPVENSLEDLRSLGDVILPGAFSVIPADARGDDRKWHEARLRREIAPYILRRTKAQVATELPPKIEQVIYCESTPAQRECYESIRAATEREIEALAYAGRPESQVRMAALTQLLRLRQVCCDPRLVSPQSVAAAAPYEDSAKLNAFRELLEEALDDGHRMLVFSQFTSLLALVREELFAREIPCCYLDGSMPPRARQAEVDRFQNDSSVPVFLISLKAGGTGLNLTGADTVVHFDPWWNPAAEAQATDRAHRIGQSRVVTSYKLIVADTVEEKVLQLQETKRSLLADVFEESDVANARLSLSELRDLAQ